jgi:D-methionine transport system substrate-binding protein
MTRLKAVALALLAFVSVAGCGGGAGKASAPAQDKTIKLITSDLWILPQIIGILKTEVARQGYVLDWVVVNDIIQPNKLVDDGTADANMFQHEPYFNQFVLDHGLKNVTRGFYTYFVPSGLFSKKYKSLDQLPEGATIGIPVDPANNGRALFMLRDKGLLQLRDGIDVTHASQKDIMGNPHHYHFKEVDQLMQQRTLEDVDAGFLFLNYAIMIGFNPTKDALALEDPHTPTYRGIVAIRKDLVGAPKIKALQNAFASEELRQLLKSKYGDAIVFLDYLNK